MGVIDFSSRIVHSILNLLDRTKDTTLQSCAIKALSCMLCRLGVTYMPFIIPSKRQMSKLIASKDISKLKNLEEYESFVSQLLKRRPLPAVPKDINEVQLRPLKPRDDLAPKDAGKTGTK